jgi:hypothetical protein
LFAVLAAAGVSLAACSGGSKSAGSPTASTPAEPAAAVSTTPTTAGLGTAFIKRDGTKLTLNGAPFRFGGFNLPCANPFVMTAGDFGHYLDVVQADGGANVIRMWFFQKNAGPANWEPFDRVVQQLKAHGMRAVATLTDEWNPGCDDGNGPQKYIDWYRTGYRQVEQGHTIPYRDYAIQVAKRYANEPAIAFWQLVNEAQVLTLDPNGQTHCDNAAAQKALRAFADDMATAIKTVDHNHLVNLGTLGGTQCGMTGSAAYQFVHDGAIDMCEYHDYGHSAVAMPTEQDLLAQRIKDCSTLPHGPKPIFVGESGIQGNVQPDGSPPQCTPWPGCTGVAITQDSLNRRAGFFTAKMNSAYQAGVAGYLIWVKSPFYSSFSDIYAIGDGDPTVEAMKNSPFATKAGG